MTVGLVVEDRYPGAIEEMCRKMGINTKTRKHRKRINVRKASAYVKDLYNDGCEKVIILADGNCNPKGERERLNEIYNYMPTWLKERVHICIVVHELESWLLADENAISQFLRHKVKITHNPEDIHDAKEYLDEIFKKAGKKYFTKMAEEIARLANVNMIGNNNFSFREFRSLAEDCPLGVGSERW